MNETDFHHHNNNRNNFDDKNRETFGDDLVDEQQRESRDRHHQQRRQQHQPYERQYSRDPARRDLMPGHVHALGILRDARERQERQYESTGNPQLDLELEKREQEEAELRKQYDSASQNPEDEFAGLMTPRERQWIINIQLQQLKCENPFIDDYYYTVYNQKREMREQDAEAALEDEGPQLKRTEEGPQLLLKPDSSRDARYLPTQFTNSLGKLQAVTVKAPRKIIDVSVVNNDLIEGSTSAQKETR